jgi:hypothetical protein
LITSARVSIILHERRKKHLSDAYLFLGFRNFGELAKLSNWALVLPLCLAILLLVSLSHADLVVWFTNHRTVNLKHQLMASA